MMDTTLLTIALVVALLIAVAALLFLRRRRSTQLRSRFGPEYERTLRDAGDQRKAESELAKRAKRVEQLNIRALSPEDKARFNTHWTTVQAEFIQDPATSVEHADMLLQEVLEVRGYPIESFDQAAADISVDHPSVVQKFRKGHEIALRHRKGDASTEDVRQAMACYGEVFTELVSDGGPGQSGSRRQEAGR
jgi:hypothetical protein